jgi:hypothetical protein
MELANNFIPKLTEWINNNRSLIAQLPKLIALLTGLFATAQIFAWGKAIIGATQLVWKLVAAYAALNAIRAGVTAAAASGAISGVSAAAGVAAIGGGAAALPILGIVAALAAVAAIGVGIKRSMDKANQPQAATGSSGFGGSRYEDNRIMTFHISDATDARAVAREVGREIQAQARSGNIDFQIDLS